ncbi:hypothetical protein VP01_2069g3 [Puccinia sorghi]|uniref:Uncharacterized protein n=1 Tax=Puccinia sorghi TaxID=27349 RepID=A0A0L6VAI3_9BASI|nr:hypothetical protein VP01_2069g3 [Puccinia sorghi]
MCNKNSVFLILRSAEKSQSEIIKFMGNSFVEREIAHRVSLFQFSGYKVTASPHPINLQQLPWFMGSLLRKRELYSRSRMRIRIIFLVINWSSSMNNMFYWYWIIWRRTCFPLFLKMERKVCIRHGKREEKKSSSSSFFTHKLLRCRMRSHRDKLLYVKSQRGILLHNFSSYEFETLITYSLLLKLNSKFGKFLDNKIHCNAYPMRDFTSMKVLFLNFSYPELIPVVCCFLVDILCNSTRNLFYRGIAKWRNKFDYVKYVLIAAGIGVSSLSFKKPQWQQIDTVALAYLKTGLGRVEVGVAHIMRSKKRGVACREYLIHLPPIHSNNFFIVFQLSHGSNIMNCTVRLVESQDAELNQMIKTYAKVWLATKLLLFGKVVLVLLSFRDWGCQE